MSRFVEDAVRERIFAMVADEARQQNSHLSEEAISDIVEEALEWARRT